MEFKTKNFRAHSHFDFNNTNAFAKSKRSQTAIEFVILVGFVLFFFAAFSLVIQGNMSDKLREKKTLAIKEIALTVQDEINLASESIDGYSRSFKLPENLNGQEYSININEGMVYIITTDKKYAMALPVANVTGNVNKGLNTIKKDNGKVMLN